MGDVSDGRPQREGFEEGLVEGEACCDELGGEGRDSVRVIEIRACAMEVGREKEPAVPQRWSQTDPMSADGAQSLGGARRLEPRAN